jgi:hypothetical protein
MRRTPVVAALPCVPTQRRSPKRVGSLVRIGRVSSRASRPNRPSVGHRACLMGGLAVCERGYVPVPAWYRRCGGQRQPSGVRGVAPSCARGQCLPSSFPGYVGPLEEAPPLPRRRAGHDQSPQRGHALQDHTIPTRKGHRTLIVLFRRTADTRVEGSRGRIVLAAGRRCGPCLSAAPKHLKLA